MNVFRRVGKGASATCPPFGMVLWARFALPTLLLFLLASCATVPIQNEPLNQNISWNTRQSQLNSITEWKLQGAVALATAHGGQNASMTWQQDNGDYQIDLFGPLGVGHTTLKGNANSVVLLANGKTTQANSPEMLMQAVLGWQLPISHLYYWVRGIPAPNLAKTMTFDPYHHLMTLSQQGWTIQYQRYSNVQGIDVPTKILLKNGEVRAVIVISDWEFK